MASFACAIFSLSSLNWFPKADSVSHGFAQIKTKIDESDTAMVLSKAAVINPHTFLDKGTIRNGKVRPGCGTNRSRGTVVGLRGGAEVLEGSQVRRLVH